MTHELPFVFAVSMIALVGCAAPSADENPEAAAQADEELKQSECPAKVEVTIQKPSILSDTALLRAWERDFESDYSDEAAEARAQLTAATSHLAKARTQDVVKLKGTVGQRCFYATTDAATGRANGFHIWFAKTGGRNGELQLRITRDLATDDTLFFNAKVKTLSPTALTMDTSRDARVYAQHAEEGYHGEPAGMSAWIGSAKVTAKLGH